MTNQPEDESLPTDIPGLEVALAGLEERLAHSASTIRELMESEDPARGVFHAAAIHEAKQAHMVLRYRQDFCRARLARLRSQE
ncbi:hypothetical protein LJC59_05900 [Desulfovibrio sp. OttesenSCG-928-A18]|nr:hypothetical protein [Desulfovibrio sp. OttesenSCG-928-A18]